MIKKQEKRNKIFYVPGMISLIFIPLFCFYHFYKVDAFKEQRSIDFYFPDDSIMKQQLLIFKRNNQVFNFNNSEIVEKQNFENLRLALRKLKRENDTLNGIKIHLGNKMTYEVYIRLLDIFIIEKIPNYVQYKNDFFVLMLPKPKQNKNMPKIIPITCGYWEANKDYFLKIERDKQFAYVLNLYRKYWVIFLGYLGIVIINIFALVNVNKNK
ncbi:hypothetical protein [Flavobacterium sp. N1736]|uniref:hypothetical protein n=1 Tax=Flavobacterium sp. N1736 TaxID=2986823 RepID=UPI002224C507|nr:hypothetical protein [Flavobacterium sp. N1736]